MYAIYAGSGEKERLYALLSKVARLKGRQGFKSGKNFTAFENISVALLNV